MKVSQDFKLLAFDTDNRVVRCIGESRITGDFELWPREMENPSANVSKAMDVFLIEQENYERVTFVCYWKYVASHAVVQVHGINGKQSQILFAGIV